MTSNNTVFSLLARRLLIIMAIASLGFSQLARAEQDKNILLEIKFDQRLGQKLPQDVSFLDENNKPVRLADYLHDKPVVLAPVYYECPMLCTLTLNGILRATRAIRLNAGEDYHVVAFSINPKEKPDLAKAKKETYLKGYNRPSGDKGWHFLTGDETNINKLTDSIGFKYVYDPKSNQYAHAAGILIITADGTISKYLLGSEFSAKDLRLALVEAAQNQIGTVVDQVLLYCFHYDPKTGKYSLAIMNIVRAAGLITLLIVVFFVVGMIRRERRKKNNPADGQ